MNPTLNESQTNPWVLRLLLIAWLGSPAYSWSADPYARARVEMVRQHIESAGITNPRVLESMRTTPRHEFLKPSQVDQAYFDMAIPIGHGQTISPPYIVAFMTAKLDPQPTDRVLEIGTGSGYQAAVLSPLAQDVYTIEIVEPLGLRAREVLQRLGYENVHTRIGDGYKGWPEHAPFDKIIVTCSPEEIPQPLIDQLAEGGQIIIPVGERFQQTLCRFNKRQGKLEREALQETFFVPMTGQSEDQRKVKPDKSSVEIEHGGFEETVAETDMPAGWYYVREAKVVATDEARDGQHLLRFENSVNGRSAHALQAFGVDGEFVQRIEVRMWVQANRIRSGRQRYDQARALVEFYGENRAPVGRAVLGPWTGSFDWTEQVQSIDVPPQARLAVVGVGLFGATGTLDVDQVSVRAK